ncbi:MAG TPA: Rieske 2Fe-2S domain-containing protein [Kofleriaceae bacterium]|jgi:nitrite reductase/ring-hydroxylating ferredoxin subunit|nr:Rieske 2Fe-2S domain-containing protein [Kofleriaceae bacterium]
MARRDVPAAPRVIHVDRREANALEVGEDLYLFLEASDSVLVPARCPHRGGPLHLATMEHGAQGAVLVCPWHGTNVPLRALVRRAVATVQSGDRVRAVLDAPGGAEIVARHIPVHVATDGTCAGNCPGGHQKGSPRS